MGGNGRVERHVRPGGKEGHCDWSRSVIPFMHSSISISLWNFTKTADSIPPGVRKSIKMEISNQPFSPSLVGEFNITAAERI